MNILVPMKLFLFRKYWRRRILLAMVLWWWFFSIHSIFGEFPTSTVMFDRNHELLSAKIAADGQFRFPASDSIPWRFQQCILTFEDQHFYNHPGVHLPSILRATKQNVSSGEVVSGGSTITMQTIRLLRGNPDRTVMEKVFEMARALRLECSFSKEEILTQYCQLAPMGGNVVGLETASWRYYNSRVEDLSWAQCATLAVLPNAPGLLYPGRNTDPLRAKRNRLLQALHRKGFLDDLELQLSLPRADFKIISQHLSVSSIWYVHQYWK